MGVCSGTSIGVDGFESCGGKGMEWLGFLDDGGRCAG